MPLTTNNAATNMLKANEIAERIPHGESMSLLDQVCAWDKEQIICTTRSHLRSNNPLKVDGSLSSISLIEYGAQAAAVHASLLQENIGSTRPAYLGAIKSLALLSDTVPQINDDLSIQAKAELHSLNGAIYFFTASLHKTELVKGRLVLMQPS